MFRQVSQDVKWLYPFITKHSTLTEFEPDVNYIRYYIPYVGYIFQEFIFSTKGVLIPMISIETKEMIDP